MKIKDSSLPALYQRSFWFILFCVGFFIYFILENYEIQFSNFAAKVTNFAVGNGWNLRYYDAQGIPYSYIARLREKVVSPYYVVHYGLIYSQSVNPPAGYEWIWPNDDSFKLWGENPPSGLITKENFINAADWIIRNLEKDEYGNTHIFYHFQWPYEGTSEGYLQAPWYSGLTDAIAIKLLIRAYAFTKDKRYFDAASRLYNSVLTQIDKGGSLVYDEFGNPWIEEYISRNNTKIPFVLNGMIYATLAILDYERFSDVEKPMGYKLIETIKKRTPAFDTGYWTFYDLLGTLAKPKYHFIHVSLMKVLYEKTKDPFFLNVHSRWEKYNTHFFTRYFIKHRPTVNSIVVLCISFVFWILITVILYIVYNIVYKFWRREMIKR